MALTDLPQYHFDRGEFTAVCREILTDDGIDRMCQACLGHVHTENFLLTYHQDEYYVLHRDSGVMVNWYKHLGRTNTCNSPGMGTDGLREFLSMLADDLAALDS